MNKNRLTPEGIEPPIFGSGIRRVAIAPWSQRGDSESKGSYNFWRLGGETFVRIHIVLRDAVVWMQEMYAKILIVGLETEESKMALL